KPAGLGRFSREPAGGARIVLTPLNDTAQHAEIKNYVAKAFLAKILQMNETREKKKRDLRAALAVRGHANSGSWVLGEIEIEENCLADLLRQKWDLYLEAYEKTGLKIGLDVPADIAHSLVEI